MNKYGTLLGLLLFGALVVNFVCQFGTQWEFGRYYMPRTVLGADGGHHPDGSEVDPVTLMLMHSGHEEEFFLGVFIFLVVMFGLLVVKQRRLNRLEREFMRRSLELRGRFAKEQTQ